jgi:hypothetical protein
MNETLYQYAVILHPTKDGREKGERSAILVKPSEWILARSEQEVLMIATREIPESQMANADRIQIAIRPF